MTTTIDGAAPTEPQKADFATTFDLMRKGEAISYTAGAAPSSGCTPWRVVGADISATTRNFNFALHSFPGVNLPASARQNTVAVWGWNVAPNSTREDTDDSYCVWAFEEHYHQGGTSEYPANEVHLATGGIDGVNRRPLTFYLPKVGNGSSGLIQVDVLGINNGQGEQCLQFNMAGASKNIQVLAGTDFVVAQNNFAAFRQQSADESRTYPLPFIDLNDSIRLTAVGAVVVGPAPTTGDYANQFIAQNCTSLAADGIHTKGYLPAITGDAYATSYSGDITGTLTAQVRNSSVGANASVVQDLCTAGSGDSYTRYRNYSTEWYSGYDQSATKLIWGTGGSFAAANKMSLDASGNLRIVGSLGVGNSAAATTLGSVVKRMEVFDAAGTSLGFMPIYNSIS